MIRSCFDGHYLLDVPSGVAAGTITYAQLAGVTDANAFRGGQVYAQVTGSPQFRYISDWAPATGVATLVTSFSGSPTDTTVEIIDGRGTFDQLNHAIDMAIAELNATVYDFDVDETLISDDGQNEYLIPSTFVTLKRVFIDGTSFASDRYLQHLDQFVSPVLLTASTQRVAQALLPYTEVRLGKLWLPLRISVSGPTGTIRFNLRSDTPATVGPPATEETLGSVLVNGATYNLTNLTTSQRFHGLSLTIPYNIPPTTKLWWELDVSGVTFNGGTIELLGNTKADYLLGAAYSSVDSGSTWKITGHRTSSVVDETLVGRAVSLSFVAKDERNQWRPLQRYNGKPGRPGYWRVGNEDANGVLTFVNPIPGGLPLQLAGQSKASALTLDSDTPDIDGKVIADLACAIFMEERAGGDLKLARLAKDRRAAAEARALRLSPKGVGAMVDQN